MNCAEKLLDFKFYLLSWRYKRRSSDKNFHLDKYGITNAAAVLNWRYILRLAGNVGISDNWGKPKTFSSDCLVTEKKKSRANAAIFWIFSVK